MYIRLWGKNISLSLNLSKCRVKGQQWFVVGFKQFYNLQTNTSKNAEVKLYFFEHPDAENGKSSILEVIHFK